MEINDAAILNAPNIIDITDLDEETLEAVLAGKVTVVKSFIIELAETE